MKVIDIVELTNRIYNAIEMEKQIDGAAADVSELEGILADIRNLPTLDLVHCEECEYFDEIEGSKFGYCKKNGFGYISPTWEVDISRKLRRDFFCGDGIRKE